MAGARFSGCTDMPMDPRTSHIESGQHTCVAWWLLGLGNVHWPQIWEGILLKNYISFGTLVSACLVGGQSRRMTTPIRNPRVPGVLDRLDV